MASPDVHFQLGTTEASTRTETRAGTTPWASPRASIATRVRKRGREVCGAEPPAVTRRAAVARTRRRRGDGRDARSADEGDQAQPRHLLELPRPFSPPPAWTGRTRPAVTSGPASFLGVPSGSGSISCSRRAHRLSEPRSSAPRIHRQRCRRALTRLGGPPGSGRVGGSSPAVRETSRLHGLEWDAPEIEVEAPPAGRGLATARRARQIHGLGVQLYGAAARQARTRSATSAGRGHVVSLAVQGSDAVPAAATRST